MRLLWHEKAWEDYCYWQTQDKTEPLKEDYNGWWSRRIDEENRIVYREKDGAIVIAACKGHYED